MTSIYGAGRLDRKASFQRRSALAGSGFLPLDQAWANFRPTGIGNVDFAGMPIAVQEGIATVRANGFIANIRPGDRVMFDGGSYDVVAVPPSDARSGMVSLHLTEAVTPAAVREQMDARGEVITIRRGTGASAVNVKARARVTGYAADELVGDIHQGDRKIFALAEDVTLNPAVQQGDRVILRGKPLNVIRVDDSTWRIAGDLIAYEITARGGS